MRNTKLLKHTVPCTNFGIIIILFLLQEPNQSGSIEGDDEHINTYESETLQKVWEFCKKQSKNVEVLYENMNGCKILTRVHFRFDPHVKKLLNFITNKINRPLCIYVTTARTSRRGN